MEACWESMVADEVVVERTRPYRSIRLRSLRGSEGDKDNFFPSLTDYENTVIWRYPLPYCFLCRFSPPTAMKCGSSMRRSPLTSAFPLTSI
jgi:hypothetical protein